MLVVANNVIFQIVKYKVYCGIFISIEWFFNFNILEHFTVQNAKFITDLLQGITEDPVKPVDRLKHFGSSKNLQNVSNLSEIAANLKTIAAEICVRLKNDREEYNRSVVDLNVFL